MSEHSRLDAVEKRLSELQSRQQEQANGLGDHAPLGRIEPSSGRINEVDLRSVINLTDDDDSDFESRFAAFASHADDDDDDDDFESRFAAFASHTDELRERGWLGSE